MSGASLPPHNLLWCLTAIPRGSFDINILTTCLPAPLPCLEPYLNVQVPSASTRQLHIAQLTIRSDSRLAALGPDSADLL